MELVKRKHPELELSQISSVAEKEGIIKSKKLFDQYILSSRIYYEERHIGGVESASLDSPHIIAIGNEIVAYISVSTK